MKKYLLLLFILITSISCAKALEIKELGFKSKDLKDIQISTRDNTSSLYFMQQNDLFGYYEDDKMFLYIRAITNPGIVDYNASDDLIDEVFSLLSKVNTSTYSYITHDDYKWIRFDFKDSKDRPMLEYFLCWKDVYITITYGQKSGDLSAETKNTIDEFVQSIDLTGKGKVPKSNFYKEGIEYYEEKNIKKNNYIIEIIMCVLAIGATWFITRKKI